MRITFHPLGRAGQFPKGTTLLEAARQLGVGLRGICGGQGTCGTCRVGVPPEGWDARSPPSSTELDLLGGEKGVRLACQARVLAPLSVLVPPESLASRQRTQTEGKWTPTSLAPPLLPHDLEQGDPRTAISRLGEMLGRPLRLDPALLSPSPPETLLRAVVRGDEVVALLPRNIPILGLALDLGTTKLAGYLVDLESGETLASGGLPNPQAAWGDDVMSRLRYAIEEHRGPERLQQAVVEGIASLLERLLARIDGRARQVVEMTVAGNTAMHHLFLRLPTRTLGRSPYEPVERGPLDVRAREVGLNLAPGAFVHLLPNIAGFVGGDHVAALLATRLDEVSVPTLLLDIGTNTEIALATQEGIICCSAASGPAFEGAHIRFGMRSAPGAIEHVRLLDGQVLCETVGGGPPVGICGSGILDAVAELRRAGLLDGRGHLKGGVFPLASGPERPITISQKDIGEVLLAKAAIGAGWRVLLEEAGLEERDLGRVVVAGAFGTYISVESGVRVGLLPDVPLARFEQVGNVAGTGARMVLISVGERERAGRIARQARYIELTTHPAFRRYFVRGLGLK